MPIYSESREELLRVRAELNYPSSLAPHEPLKILAQLPSLCNSETTTTTMSMNGAIDQRRDHSPANAAVVPAEAPRVRLNPSMEHKPDNYDDLPLEFCPVLFSCLERYLLPSMLTAPRDTKVDHMREILLSYSPEAERIKVRIG